MLIAMLAQLPPVSILRPDCNKLCVNNITGIGDAADDSPSRCICVALQVATELAKVGGRFVLQLLRFDVDKSHTVVPVSLSPV